MYIQIVILSNVYISYFFQHFCNYECFYQHISCHCSFYRGFSDAFRGYRKDQWHELVYLCKFLHNSLCPNELEIKINIVSTNTEYSCFKEYLNKM